MKWSKIIISVRFKLIVNGLFRRQFDLANREAMDESAEWRRMYDHELDRAKSCNSELNKVSIFRVKFP